MTTHDADYEKKKEKLEQGIAKCRDTISLMEVKLKKVLDRVKSVSSSSPSKNRRAGKKRVDPDMSANASSLMEESKDRIETSMSHEPSMNEESKSYGLKLRSSNKREGR